MFGGGVAALQQPGSAVHVHQTLVVVVVDRRTQHSQVELLGAGVVHILLGGHRHINNQTTAAESKTQLWKKHQEAGTLCCLLPPSSFMSFVKITKSRCVDEDFSTEQLPSKSHLIPKSYLYANDFLQHQTISRRSGFWKLLRLHVCSSECFTVVPVNLQTTLARLQTIFHFQLEIFPYGSYSDYLFPILIVISFIFHTYYFFNCHFHLISLIIYIFLRRDNSVQEVMIFYGESLPTGENKM